MPKAACTDAVHDVINNIISILSCLIDGQSLAPESDQEVANSQRNIVIRAGCVAAETDCANKLGGSIPQTDAAAESIHAAWNLPDHWISLGAPIDYRAGKNHNSINRVALV